MIDKKKIKIEKLKRDATTFDNMAAKNDKLLDLVVKFQLKIVD